MDGRARIESELDAVLGLLWIDFRELERRFPHGRKLR